MRPFTLSWAIAGPKPDAGVTDGLISNGSGRPSTLDTVETTTDPKKVRWTLEKAIRDGLGDAPRSGSPGKFSAHDYCQIMGVSLEEPALSGRPISHWGLTELTQEVIKRGIVASISRSQVGSFLKRERHQTPQDPGLAQP